MTLPTKAAWMTGLFSLLLLLLLAYSYVLIDPNITLFNAPLWASAREYLVQIGYYERGMSAAIYCAVIGLLFVFHYYFIKNVKISLKSILIPLAIFGVLSYPLLSHDFFNYLFDAKILTYYHLNPYTYRALDFPHDPWIRFMHWTHRTYPYGPTFLVLTLLPSLLSSGKFIIAFFLTKLVFVAAYVAATVLLYWLKPRWGIGFATHPLVIIEGLMVGHNDLLAVALALIGIYYVYKNNQIVARTMLVLSGGVKYITLALVFITPKNRTLNKVCLIITLLLVIYAAYSIEIQPWYFLSLFALLPYYEKWLAHLDISLAGLLLSYYPFVRYGEWDAWELSVKHEIIFVFVALNVIYLVARQLKTRPHYAV